MSSCYCLEYDKAEVNIQCRELDPYFESFPFSDKLKDQSTIFKNMILESIDPPGKFLIMKMTDQRLM